MSNPINTLNLRISEELYNRMNEIKTTKKWTFDTLIRNLCDLEMQHNYIDKIIEYGFSTENGDGVFKVTFKKNNFTIEYLTNNGYTNKIKEWNMSSADRTLFLKFIHNDCARCILENLEVAIDYRKFSISVLM